MSASGAGKPMGDGLARWISGNREGGPVAAPRDAATVILLRDAPAGPGYEVFLVRRAREIAFMGGAHVFPGGRVEKADAGIEAAACREVLEETGLSISAEALLPWARWITPSVEPKRFDARFFVTRLPPGAAPGADRREVTEAVWLSPAEAVARADRGEIVLPPPTLWNLLDLAALETIEAVLAAAATRDLTPIEPRVLAGDDGVALVLPGDPCYEDPTARPALERQRRFVLEGGRWRARRGAT